MRCSTCGAENAEDRRFCAGCGAPLSRGCPTCGFRNQPEARFCGGCGAALGASEASTDRARAIPPSELRQATILFADLVGFVELSSRLEPEETHVILDRVFAAIDGLVERYGGAVDKHIGDAVMAVFGAPVAHGDDPLRAVRAAVKSRAAVAQLGEELGQPLEIHIGVAAGEVMAAGIGRNDRQEYTVVGESVNLAARLNEMAGPGETLISDAVHRAVADHVDCDLVGETQIRGLAEPVRVWRVRSLLQEGAVRRRQTPFVGRLVERRQFTGILESCRDTGRGHAVLLRGEAGIGKSRLMEEFAAMAENFGFGVHRGLVLDFGAGTGKDAVRALVRGLLGIRSRGTDPGEAEARQAAAEAAIQAGLLKPDQRVFLNDLLNLPQPLELRAIYDAMDGASRNRGKREVVAGLIQGASARRPVMLIVEDIHWADPSTLGYLATIAAAVGDCAALLAMTSRPEGDPLDQAWRAAARGSLLTTIDLGPLRREEAAAIADAFIADATSRRATACIERAGGNPLFLEQLLRNAEESDAEELPASVQSLVLARMDRLPPRDKQALQAASVIGQHFAPETLRHLIDDPAYDCATLLRHRLLTPDGDGYLFAHVLIREGAYGSLLKARRRTLHRKAADWFAAHDPVLRAQHLDRAGDPAAPRAYLDAAFAQAAAYRYERALRLVESGLALASAQDDRSALLRLRGDLLHDLGNIPESIACHEQALEAAQDDADRCRAWIGLAAGMRMVDRYKEALDALDRAEAVAGDGLALEHARLHHLRGNLYFPLARLDACRAEHERALDFARRAGSPEEEARALGGLGDAEYARGRMITAHRYFEHCIKLSRSHGFGRIKVANLPMMALTRHFLMDFEGFRAGALEAVESATRVGHRRAEIIARHGTFIALFETAQLAPAEEQASRACEIARQLGARRFEAEALGFLSMLRRAEGRRPEAAALAAGALEVCRAGGGMDYIGPCLLACLARATEDDALREDCLAEAESILEAGTVSHNYLWFYRDALDLTLESGDWDRAERYAAALESYTRAEPLPWSDFLIARARALTAHGRGVRGDATFTEIRRLRDEARRVGWATVAPALEVALAA